MNTYYDDGTVTIYNADCRDVLPNLQGESVDLVLTDPPYGVNFQSNMRVATDKFDRIEGDDVVDTAWLEDAARIMRDGSAAYIATHWRVWEGWRAAIEDHLELRNMIVWAKGGGGMGDLAGDYAPEHEIIAYAVKGGHKLRGKRLSNVWQVKKDRAASYVHPTQKPVALMARAIEKSTDKGDVVIDPFMGSGTTLRAALDTGRRAIGVELDERYCAAAVDRLAQQSLFAV